MRQKKLFKYMVSKLVCDTYTYSLGHDYRRYSKATYTYNNTYIHTDKQANNSLYYRCE